MAKRKTKSKKTESIKRRVWELQSQCYHEGKEIWTPEIVTSVIEKLEEEKLDNGKPALKRWAWCMHDKDKVLEENIEQLRIKNPNTTLEIGDPRPAHIHLALEFENAVYNTHLQKISGLPIEFVRKPNARYNQFMAIATYLSHQRAEELAKGKYHYPTEEIHCSSGFDYDKEVKKYLIVRDKKEEEIRKAPRYVADMTINMIERGELSVEDAKEQIKETKGFAYFLRYEKEFRAARTEFVKRHYEMKPRINYYIYGSAGSGKSTISKYLAKALFPDLKDFECYYTVGAAGVRFDDYNYEPILIWEDVRGEELLREYKREGLLNLLEPSPKKRSYNIKYGKVTLTHQVNIFTGPVPFQEFIEVMMGSYSEGGQKIEEDRDKEQAFRRFPVIINVKSNEIEVLTNTRIFEDTDTSEYKRYARILNVSIAQLNEFYTGDALDQAFSVITEPIVNLHRKYMERMSGDKKRSDKEDAPSRIEIIEGYDEVEESIKTEREPYHLRCKYILDNHRLSDGTFGPYVSNDEWMLGDELDGEHEGLFCPFTYEQWITMGRPKASPDNDMVDILDNWSSVDISKPYEADGFTSDIDEANEEYERLLALLPVIREYKEAIERGETPSLPEGISEEDLEASEYLELDDDEFADIPDLIDDSDDYKEILLLTEHFLKTKDEEDLKAWVVAISNLSAHTASMEDCWFRVRDAVLKSGLAKDEIDWYRLYQTMNCKKNKISL